MKTLHMIIKGRVQGVCFRAFVEDNASSLGVSGWVKNLPDGSVEVTAEGEEDKLKKLESLCNKGPSRANVISVDSDWEEKEGNLQGFRIRY